MPKNRRTLNVFTFRDEQRNTYQLVPLASIVSSPYQPRQYFDPNKLEELTYTVKKHGVLEPLLVRLIPHSSQYELVAGERRYRAAQKAALSEVPVIVLDLTDLAAREVALVDNLQREDLNPVEETEGILNLLAIHLDLPVKEVNSLLYRLQKEKKGKAAHNVVGQAEKETVESVFESLGLLNFESFVNHRLPLLKLPQDILEALRTGKIAYTKARAIARVEDPQQRQALLDEVLAQNLSLSQIREKIEPVQLPSFDSENLTTEQRAKQTFKQITKSRLWNDPKKKKKFEKLLAQLEALMAD